MSEFKEFKVAMQKQFDRMVKDSDTLFITGVEKDVIWDTYLDSFPEGTNNVFKERREFECNSCRQFLRPYGNVVAIKNNTMVSIWDIKGLDYPFDVVAEKLATLVKSEPIKNVFATKFAKLGIDKNHMVGEDNSITTWDHFYFDLPKTFVDRTPRSVGEIHGYNLSSKEVFERSMRELTIDAGNTVLELIDQDSIYRGSEHRSNVVAFISYKSKYDTLPDDEKDNWCWANLKNPVARIRNTAIGTLLIDLSKGVDLDEAVRKFEAVMAPTNYKRPKEIFTKRMIEEAEKKIMELGFENSLARKYAALEDITINNVLWTNRDVKKKLGGSLLSDLKETVPENVKNFNKVEEVHIDDFIKNILPTATNIELMVEPRHSGNMVSLVAPEDVTAPSMLKWSNNFSWAYVGDVADSMKQNVKKAGGNVDGVLRFSIQWNEDGKNHNDFDAHCIEPRGGEHIYFGSKMSRNTGGNLDVDIINPSGVAVENITWPEKNKMLEGEYVFSVHNFSQRDGHDGFTAEIEYEGQIYSYSYPKSIKNKDTIEVARILFSKKDGIKFISSLDSSLSSKAIAGVPTNRFTKVSVAMYSPNYWDEQEGKGPKHHFFFLDGCKIEDTPRGFFNEHLSESLRDHRKVFEALGSKFRVAPSNNQLSGLGFSSTMRNSIIAKVEGNFSRTIKIIF